MDFTQPGPLDVVGSAIGAFVTTLVVSAIMIAIALAYVKRMMGTLEDAPVGSFVYGLVCLLDLVLVTIVLVITVIGIFVAVPLILLAIVIWAVGAAIAYLVIAERLVDRGAGWTKPLLVAATLTGVGGIVAFGIGAAGIALHYGTADGRWSSQLVTVSLTIPAGLDSHSCEIVAVARKFRPCLRVTNGLPNIHESWEQIAARCESARQ